MKPIPHGGCKFGAVVDQHSTCIIPVNTSMKPIPHGDYRPMVMVMVVAVDIRIEVVEVVVMVAEEVMVLDEVLVMEIASSP